MWAVKPTSVQVSCLISFKIVFSWPQTWGSRVRMPETISAMRSKLWQMPSWTGKMRMVEDGNAWAGASKLEELINRERLAIWS